MKRTICMQAATLLLLFVLAYTTASKAFNFPHFSRAMLSQPIPKVWASVLTYAIPILELIAVIAILLPTWRKIGLGITAGIMTAFTFYVLYIKMTGLHNTTCPCGGLFASLTWNQHLIVNLLLTILSYWTLYINNIQKRIPGQGKRGNADASKQTK